MCDSLITSSMIILVIAGLRLLFRSKVSSRLIYGLWLPVALWLLLSLPFGWGEESQIAAIGQFFQIPVLGITLGQLATILWIVGALAMAIWLLAANIAFRKALRSSREAFDCPESPVPVWVSPAVSAPCLFGLFRPAIYLTPDCAADPERRHHVLTHELTHLRHWDHVWNILRSLCLCVYWFHPPVWLAVHLSKQDSELACDEGALKRLGEEQRLAYGKTIVDLAATGPRKPKRVVDQGAAPKPGAMKKQAFAAGLLVGAFILGGVAANWLLGDSLAGIFPWHKQPVTLESVSVEQMPHKEHYVYGQKLNLLGLTLRLTYSDGTAELTTYGFTCSPMQLNELGTQKITVSYEGKTTEFSVSVGEVLETGMLGKELSWILTTEYDLIIEGKGAPEYGTGWYRYTDHIRSITLPMGMTEITSMLFYNCSNVKEIWIPDSVTVIRNEAFFQCYSLESCVISPRVNVIEEKAFYHCERLQKVTLPTALKKIGKSAFEGCFRLEEVTLPKGLVQLENHAFKDCSSLRQIVIPGSVKVLEYVFNNCTGLQEVIIEEGVEQINCQPFVGCDALAKVTVPASVSVISPFFCMDNISLQSISVHPNNKHYTSDACGALYTKDNQRLLQYPVGRNGSYSVASNCRVIERYAFRYCAGLTAITLPDSLEAIESWAFMGCTGLEEVTIPSEVKRIDMHAFQNCTGLRKVTVLNTKTDIGYADDTLGISYKTHILCYAGSTAHAYAKACRYPYQLLS